MKIIYEKRGTGKTSKLIQMSHDMNTYILTVNQKRAALIAKMAHEMGIAIPYPVTVDDYMRCRFRGSFIKDILIDDADDVLKQIFHTVNIEAITMTDRNK